MEEGQKSLCLEGEGERKEEQDKCRRQSGGQIVPWTLPEGNREP